MFTQRDSMNYRICLINTQTSSGPWMTNVALACKREPMEQSNILSALSISSGYLALEA